MQVVAQRHAYKTMPQPKPSVLVDKLASFVPLDDREVVMLQRCERSSRNFGRRKIVRRQGEDSSELFVLRGGWAFSFAIMPDGGRQVLDLHFPGDVIGSSSIAFEKAAIGIATITPVELSPFPKALFADVAATTPHLSILLHAMAALENMILIDRLKSIGRMEARDRVALFLLQIITRLEVMDHGIGSVFTLPMSQELIGDALGLSSIHVNRTLRRLEEEGDVSRDGQQITLHNRAKLAESVDFANRYDQIRTDWFPD